MYKEDKVCNLMQGSSRDKDRVPQELDNGAALYAVLLKQTLPLLTAKVPARLSDWIVLWRDVHTLLFRDLQATKHDTGSETIGSVHIWYQYLSRMIHKWTAGTHAL